MKTKIEYIDKELEKTKLVLDAFEEQDLPKNGFCVVPFTTIILEPNGNVGVCRLHGTDEALGNLSENTIEEIWNGENYSYGGRSSFWVPRESVAIIYRTITAICALKTTSFLKVQSYKKYKQLQLESLQLTLMVFVI